MRYKTLFGQVVDLMLGAVLIPLAGAGVITLTSLHFSARDQAREHQEQLGGAASALVRQYIKDGQTRLKLIASRLPKGSNAEEIARQLDRQMDPPGIFLEISLVEVQGTPEVLVQSQQSEYNSVLSANAPALGNRAYSSRLNQQTRNFDNGMADIAVPLKGGEFASDTLDFVKEVPALPISVPGPQHRVITANLDFRPLAATLAALSGKAERSVALEDGAGKLMLGTLPEGNDDRIQSRVPVGHGRWVLAVSEPTSMALSPSRTAINRAYWMFAIIAMLALVKALFFARKVVRPVEALSKATHELAAGNLAVRSGISRDDEIGQLAKAFDQMAASVQKLDEMKGDFVAHVSHELRTPLTSAKVALANVQEGISGKEALGRVQEDLDRLIRMVNELLDVARIEAGLQLAKQPTDLGGLVRCAVDTLRPIARVPLTVTGSGDTVDLDPARVQQILVNLVDNALKYAKGRVEVEVQGREVRVTDDGPGVPPEHRERIFEKFSKVETGPKPPGAGLGLSIARKLAQLHGGTLTCAGNTFVLRF